MHGHRVTHIDDPGPLKVPAALSFGALGLGILGLLVFVYGAFLGGDVHVRQNAWAGFFVSAIFFWFLAMGAAAFLAIQYTTTARWFVVLKRLPEAVASWAYRGGFAFVLFTLLGVTYLYPWANSGHYQELWGIPAPKYPYPDTLKAAWFTIPMHSIKVLFMIGVLAIASFMLVKASSVDEAREDGPLKLRRKQVSIVFLIVFAFLFSLFSWDGIMSVEPKWFSTMFGVYCFAGAFVSALALMMLMAFYLQSRTPYVPGRQMYDLGTYVMGFSVFMIYIGFSQFMLIWYANIYDETFFYLKRYEGGWMIATVLLPILKWAIPFLLLMPPPFRRNLIIQSICCTSIIAGQLLDLYWVIYPAYYSELVMPSFVNVLTFLGLGGLFTFSTLGFLAKQSILPVKDADFLPSVNGDYLHA